MRVRWVGHRELLWQLVDKEFLPSTGDEQIAARASWDTIIGNLQHGRWAARTNAPSTYRFEVGGTSIPLHEGGVIDANFWREYAAAKEVGADRESLSRGGAWAQNRYDQDTFAFFLPRRRTEFIEGFAEAVQIQVRTGKLAKPGRGRPPGEEGSKSYRPDQEAVARIIADIEASATVADQRAAKLRGIEREATSLLSDSQTSDLNSVKDRLRSKLRHQGYGREFFGNRD